MSDWQFQDWLDAEPGRRPKSRRAEAPPRPARPARRDVRCGDGRLSILRRIAAILPLLGSASISEVLHAARDDRADPARERPHLADLAARLVAPPPPPPPPLGEVVPFPRAMPPERVPRAALRCRGNSIAEAPQRRVKSAWAIDRDDIPRSSSAGANWTHGHTSSSKVFTIRLQGGRTLSEKQRDKLNEILDKLGA